MRIARVVLGCLATATLALAALTHGQAQAPSTLLIRGATIIDGVSDAPLRDRSLLIEGNTIRDLLPPDAAGPATSCALPVPSGECLKFRRHQMCRASGMPMHSKDADASKGRLNHLR